MLDLSKSVFAGTLDIFVTYLDAATSRPTDY